jgi:Domain of unknown function (DUF5710)
LVVVMTRIWLDVPFSDKDTAKAAGARWDEAERRWYAPRPGMPGLARWAARPELPEVLPGEDRAYGTGLFVDLIPQTSWFENVRKAVDPADWDRLRRMVYRRAGYRCEACGTAQDRGRGVVMEAHERFAYDARAAIQRLVRLVCLCRWCHTAAHMGLAGLRGVQDEAITHLMAVTGMNPAEAFTHVDEAFERWTRRSAIPWQVDLSLITGAGIGLSETAAAPSASSAGLWEAGEDDAVEDETGILIITALTEIRPVPAARRASLPKREPGPAERALAASYERYAAELAEIEALRSRQHSA